MKHLVSFFFSDKRVDHGDRGITVNLENDKEILCKHRIIIIIILIITTTIKIIIMMISIVMIIIFTIEGVNFVIVGSPH